MPFKKLLYIIVPIIIVIAGLAIIPRYFENRIKPNFQQSKVDEVRTRNEALYQEMLTNFDKAVVAVREDEKDVSNWTILGTIADTFGDDELASKAYKEAIGIDPTLFMVRNNLAALYLRQEKYSEAEAQYKEILKNNPADIQTHESLARLYASEKIGSKADAKRILEEGIAKTNDPYLKELLGRVERGEDL